MQEKLAFAWPHSKPLSPDGFHASWFSTLEGRKMSRDALTSHAGFFRFSSGRAEGPQRSQD